MGSIIVILVTDLFIKSSRVRRGQIPRAGFSCIQHSFMFLPEKPERGHHVFHVFLNCLVKESLYIYSIVIYSHFLDHLIFDLV